MRNRKMSTLFTLGAVCFALGSWVALWKIGFVSAGADTDHHFQLAFWGWHSPHLWFDHWGKPLFTLLLAPAARFGFNTAILFQGMIHASTSWMIYSSIQGNKVERVLLGALYFFLPVTFEYSFGLTTEPLFSGLLFLSFVLIQKKANYWAVLILSGLAFIRNEGVLFLPLFVGFLYLKYPLRDRIKLTLALLPLPLILWVAGSIAYDSWNWMIEEFPYSGTMTYGAGSLWHFLIKWESMFGIGVTLGMVYLGVRHSWKVNSIISLAFATVLIFFGAHSISWASGIGASLGLPRYMVSIAPFVLFLVAKGYQLSKEIFPQYRSLTLIFLFICLAENLIRIPFTLTWNQERPALKAVLDAHQEDLEKAKEVYYFDPRVATMLTINPFDDSDNAFFLLRESMPKYPNGILIWDAHFGVNEGAFPLEEAQKKTQLRYFKEFDFPTLNADVYSIGLFQFNP